MLLKNKNMFSKHCLIIMDNYQLNYSIYFLLMLPEPFIHDEILLKFTALAHTGTIVAILIQFVIYLLPIV